MIRKFFIVGGIAACLFFLSLTEGFSHGNREVRIVDTEGTSIITNNDIESARNNAIRDAIQKAVEHVVLSLIPQKTAAEKSQVIRDGIYAKSEDYIHDYRINGEKQVATNYKVGIKSKLSVSDIKDNLGALGLLPVLMNGTALTTAVMTVQGIENYADYAKIRELLKTGTRGVGHCHPQRLERGMVRLILSIQGGNFQHFANELMKTGQFSLDTMSVDHNYIEVTFLKKR